MLLLPLLVGLALLRLARLQVRRTPTAAELVAFSHDLPASREWWAVAQSLVLRVVVLLAVSRHDVVAVRTGYPAFLYPVKESHGSPYFGRFGQLSVMWTRSS